MKPDPVPPLVAAVCAYEAVAIVAALVGAEHKPPTVTAYCNRWPLLAGALTCWWVGHFRVPLTALAKEIR
jgi:hypothetical protein